MIQSITTSRVQQFLNNELSNWALLFAKLKTRRVLPLILHGLLIISLTFCMIFELYCIEHPYVIYNSTLVFIAAIFWYSAKYLKRRTSVIMRWHSMNYGLNVQKKWTNLDLSDVKFAKAKKFFIENKIYNEKSIDVLMGKVSSQLSKKPYKLKAFKIFYSLMLLCGTFAGIFSYAKNGLGEIICIIIIISPLIFLSILYFELIIFKPMAIAKNEKLQKQLQILEDLKLCLLVNSA